MRIQWKGIVVSFLGMCVFILLFLIPVVIFTYKVKVEKPNIYINDELIKVNSMEEFHAKIEELLPHKVRLLVNGQEQSEISISFDEIDVSYLPEQKMTYIKSFLQPTIIQKIYRGIREKETESIYIGIDNLNYSSQEIQEWANKNEKRYNIQPMNATITAEKGSIKIAPPRNGFNIAASDISKAIISGLNSQTFDKINVAGVEQKPSVFVEDLQPYKNIISIKQYPVDMSEDAYKQFTTFIHGMNNSFVVEGQIIDFSSRAQSAYSSILNSHHTMKDSVKSELVNEARLFVEVLYDALEQTSLKIEGYSNGRISVGNISAELINNVFLVISNAGQKEFLISTYLNENGVNIIILNK